MAYIKDDDVARVVARARQRFLESGDLGGLSVRAGIAESWRRSLSLAVEPDRLNPPYTGDVDSGSRLYQAATPVLDRLGDVIGSGMCAVLTDAQARVLDRRGGEESLTRHLDRIQLAPGFSYAERHVGTNGIGTSLQAHQPHLVLGTEHFAERLHTMACAGAPIRDPVTRKLVGLLDVTCQYKDVNPLMQSLVYNAANSIEQRLLELGSEREHAVLAEFRAMCGRTSKPIVTVSDNLIMTNAPAARLLTTADHAFIRDAVSTWLRLGHAGVAYMTLARGDRATLHFHPVETPMGAVGAVIEISVAQGS